MRTEPIEIYRGIVIYEDRSRRTHQCIQFRCTVDGQNVKAETLSALKGQIERRQGRAAQSGRVGEQLNSKSVDPTHGG